MTTIPFVWPVRPSQRQTRVPEVVSVEGGVLLGSYDLTDGSLVSPDWKCCAEIYHNQRDVLQVKLENLPKRPRTTKIDKAIALKKRKPELTASAVAEKVDCDESLLSRSARYQREAIAVETAAKESRLKAASKRTPNPLEEAIAREEAEHETSISARRK